VVRQWNPPEFYLSASAWFQANRDVESGLQLLGDFPWRGQYEAVQPLIWKGLVNGRLVIETMPLCGMIVEVLVPMIKEWTKVAAWRKEIAFRNWQAKKDQSLLQKIEEARRNAKLPWTSASYARQHSRTPLVDERMRAIEQYWERTVAMLRRQGLGVTIH